MTTLYDRVLTRGWWLILLVCAGLGVWAGRLLPRFSVEAGTDVLLNEDDADLAYYNQTRADWTYDEYVIVCAHRKEGWFTKEAVEQLHALAGRLKGIPHAKSATSILNVPLLRNAGRSGFLPSIVTLVDKTGALNPKADLAKAKTELTAHTQALGNLISASGEDASVLVYLDLPADIVTYEPERNRLLAKNDAAAKKRLAEIDPAYQVAKAELGRRRQAFVGALRALAAEWNPKLEAPLRMSGLTFINVLLMEHIQADIRNFGFLSFALFSLTYLVIYRRLRWVLLPVIACVLPVLIMLALMIVTDKKVTVVTSNMPVLLFVLMLPYSVYFIERYRERRAIDPAEDNVLTTTRSPKEIWAPCLFSALATMAGTIAHMPSGINPVRTFGLMMTIGTAVGLAIIMLFLPASVLKLPPPPATDRSATSRSWGPLKLLEFWVLKWPKAVVVFSLAILGLSVWGTTRITVETKFIDYFWPSSPIYQGLDYIDKRMGGTTPVEVLLTSETPGHFKTPEGLAALEAVGKFFEGVPETGNVRSLRTLADEVKKGFNLADEKIVGVMASIGKEQVAEFCNADFTTSRVLVRMKETAPTLNRDRILGALRKHLDSLKDGPLKGLQARPTGIFLLYSNMLNTLIAATRETFLLALGAIFLMLWGLWRSPRLAVVVLLPQVLPVFLVLGVMGFTGIALDMVTVIIASVAMGVGIDAAIQYTARFKKELEATNGDMEEAVRRSHATIGRAILIATSIVFAGFAILMISNFVPTFYFGLFTGLAILMGLFASLTTLPALFLILRLPKR